MLQQLSQEVNRKCRPRNTMVQLSTPFTDPERHNAQTDRQTTVSCQELIILHAVVRSAKNVQHLISRFNKNLLF